MRRTLVMLTLLLAGGCVSDKGPAADAPQDAKSARAKGDNGDADKPRQLCVDTVEGAESKRICY